MLNQEEVVNEGFRPLQRIATAPAVPELLPQKEPKLNRGFSFVNDSGEPVSDKQSHSLWEGSSWNKFEKSRGKILDRSNSFVGARSRSSTVDLRDGKPQAVAIVDPFSTGAHLAVEVVRRGYKCIRILSIWDSPVAALVQEGVSVEFDATIQHNDTLEDQNLAINQTIASLNALPYHIIALIPGAETGVELADSLSHRMKLLSNGEEGSLPRRNKYLMGEKIRQAGIRAVMQKHCTNVEDIMAFLHEYTEGKINEPFKAVVKPVQSAGSDDVFLCKNVDEAINAFNRIFNKVNGLGLKNVAVLIQEYLEGIEYVVDQVSRDGNHKLACIWEYDKRQVNGASFVYFGMKIMNPNTQAICQELKQYSDRVLTALGIFQGPSHMEIKYHPTKGPCLVEVGARCHGGEGTWLPVVKECVGYTKVELVIDLYTGGNLYKSVKSDTYPVAKIGMDVDLVSRFSGIVRSTPGADKIKALASYRSLSWEVKPGDFCPLTIDCFTRPGCAQLVHEDPEQLARDFEYVHSLEQNGLIDYAVITPTPPTPGAVVVVDAFSTGANLAAEVLKMGYKLILVFSETNSSTVKLVGKNTACQPTALIQHNNTSANPAEAVQQTLEAIRNVGVAVLAILPGAETGVGLADQLAAAYGTRHNSSILSEARRNKTVMQEFISKAGLRSIQQSYCTTPSDVETFLVANHLNKGSSYIVKPNITAGNDSIHLCQTVEDGILAFADINGKTNVLGQVNQGALVQEYVEGVEYAVDGVSRDGEYKIVAIWEYDKRRVNSSEFVHHSMKLVQYHDDAKFKSIVEYTEKVVNAVGILHGPSHLEIKYDEIRGPCLIEIGARCHGGEGTWLPIAKECIGYTQLDATLNCYLRPDQFDAIPAIPKLLKQGMEAFLISTQSGIIRDIPGIDIIRQLASCRRVEMLTQPGGKLAATVDSFTRPGSIQLVHENYNHLMNDYHAIRTLEKYGLFILE